MPSSSSRLSTCRFRATTSAERREAIEVGDLVRRRWNIESIKGLSNNNEVPVQETDDVHHVKDHGGDINLTSVFFHVLLVLVLALVPSRNVPKSTLGVIANTSSSIPQATRPPLKCRLNQAISQVHEITILKP